jgi:hypothetical protein
VLTRSYPRHFTFYLARPTRSIHQNLVAGFPSAIRTFGLAHSRRKVRALRTAGRRRLAEEHQVSDNAQHQHGRDHRRQVFRIKEPGRWEQAQWDSTMTAMMIKDGKRVATGGTGF